MWRASGLPGCLCSHARLFVGYPKVNSSETLSIFGDECPQNDSKNDLGMPPRKAFCGDTASKGVHAWCRAVSADKISLIGYPQKSYGVDLSICCSRGTPLGDVMNEIPLSKPTLRLSPEIQGSHVDIKRRMTTSDELPFDLHLKIYDLCINNKADY